MRSCVRPASATTSPRMCGERLRREDRLHQLVELVAVLRHADGGGELDDALARKAGEIRIEHGAENFAHAVGAEVEAQHAVAVLACRDSRRSPPAR